VLMAIHERFFAFGRSSGKGDDEGELVRDSPDVRFFPLLSRIVNFGTRI